MLQSYGIYLVPWLYSQGKFKNYACGYIQSKILVVTDGFLFALRSTGIWIAHSTTF